VEATGVQPNGRITPHCTGLWNDEQMDAFKEIVDTLSVFEAVAGIQLAHAGRKGSCLSPFLTGNQHDNVANENQGGWPDNVVAPSAIRGWESAATPREMSKEDIAGLIQSYVDASERALKAGMCSLSFFWGLVYSKVIVLNYQVSR
jgi:2,4-dienoyl-CoA reductase-like NADH-dependent reductase (Old Yellow Enzyme family)